VRPSYRLHYVSIRLSVCPIRARRWGLTRKQKCTKKNKIGVDVPQRTRKWNANFQLKRSMVKVTVRHKNRRQASCLLTGGRSSSGGSGADCKLRLHTVRPNLLPAPQTAAYHVGTRHAFLFHFRLKPRSRAWRRQLYNDDLISTSFRGCIIVVLAQRLSSHFLLQQDGSVVWQNNYMVKPVDGIFF